MIKKLYICHSNSLDPYWNIALEKHLLETVAEGCCVLYLWQNGNTVVIGRNQNAYAECNTELLAREGGHLARRLSGGGAVFHDTGNLNFTFLMSEQDYDLAKQLSVIQTACALAGISAARSGRNDLLAAGQKFSGNAFYHSGGKAYHHGTLLIHADMEKLGRYLTPSKAKLEAKGVASVRSRVVNLQDLCPALTCEGMKGYMEQAFSHVYGLPTEALEAPEQALLADSAKALGSWQWLYGENLSADFSWEKRFLWGGILLEIRAEGGMVQDVRVYSDAMDWQLPKRIENALQGCRFQIPDMCHALQNAAIDPDICRDLCGLLENEA